MKHGILIDMDGVIYSGDVMIPGADRFIARLLEEKIPFMFMTNNSQRSRTEVVRKLAKLGIHVEEHHIYTSAMATAAFLSAQIPRGAAYVLGEGGPLSSLNEAGRARVRADADSVGLGEGRNCSL